MDADPPVNRAAAEPYVTAFEATVRSVDGRAVTLDRTYFYAEGGGQPADRGTLGGAAVADVQKRDGVTVHTLDGEPGFGAGDRVEGRVDEAFRTYSMRAHTASHVVYGAGRELFDPVGYGGFDIGEERIRLDFRVDTAPEAATALSIQRLANEAVWASRAVEWYEADRAAAEADEEIVFNLGDDGAAETVRIVEIEGWDVSACGGTHVRNTREIGPIAVREVSNPGADLVRVEYAVGPAAIDHWIDSRRSAVRAAEALDTSVERLPERAERLRAENRSLAEEVEELGGKLLDARLAQLAGDTRSRDGREWLVGTVEAVGPNTAADRAGDVEAADVVALVGRDGSTFVVVATDGEVDAAEVVADATDEFGGGGGGGPTLAQGGGLDADPGTVAAYLRGDR